MRIAILSITVVIEYDGECYTAFIEDIPGIYGFGGSPEESLMDIMEALDRVIWN